MSKGRSDLICNHCKKTFSVPNCRKDKAKYCSRKCADERPREKNQVRCRECGSQFSIKKSQQERNKAWGSFCSKECISAYRKRTTIGDGNSNFRGRNFDSDGYRIYTPHASLGLGLGKIKIHHAIAFQMLGIKKIPQGMHIHHRDCNGLNNKAENLALMTISDHKWIHKQFGVATLAAIMRGDIDICVAASWSDDPIRAEALLFQDVVSQGAIKKHFEEKGLAVDLARITASKPEKARLVQVSDF